VRGLSSVCALFGSERRRLGNVRNGDPEEKQDADLELVVVIVDGLVSSTLIPPPRRASHPFHKHGHDVQSATWRISCAQHISFPAPSAHACTIIHNERVVQKLVMTTTFKFH
jgi:hypothetical protein